MSRKLFSSVALVQVASGYILRDGGIDDIYDVLNWMSGESLYTHALPRVANEMRPLLLEQVKWLSGECDKVRAACEAAADSDKKSVAIAEGIRIAEQYDAAYPIVPAGADDHESLDPINEWRRATGGKPAISFDASTGEVNEF